MARVVISLVDSSTPHLELRLDREGWVISAREVGAYRAIIPPDSLVGGQIHHVVQRPRMVIESIRRVVDTGRAQTISLVIVNNDHRAFRNAHIEAAPDGRSAKVKVYRPMVNETP